MCSGVHAKINRSQQTATDQRAGRLSLYLLLFGITCILDCPCLIRTVYRNTAPKGSNAGAISCVIARRCSADASQDELAILPAWLKARKVLFDVVVFQPTHFSDLAQLLVSLLLRGLQVSRARAVGRLEAGGGNRSCLTHVIYGDALSRLALWTRDGVRHAVPTNVGGAEQNGAIERGRDTRCLTPPFSVGNTARPDTGASLRRHARFQPVHSALPQFEMPTPLFLPAPIHVHD